MKFYERLELLLQENDESFASLSRKLEISRSLIPQAKSRNAELNDNLVKDIADIFNVSETWLRWGYIENTWGEDKYENELTPEKIIYRLENIISTITRNYNTNSDDFFDIISHLISPQEIYSVKKRRKNIDFPLFVKIAEELDQNSSYILTGHLVDENVSPWIISIAQKYDDMLKTYVCLNSDDQENIHKQITNAFFAQKYKQEHKKENDSKF